MIHNGPSVSLFINPNPDNTENYPNEFFRLENFSVVFSTNLKILIGHKVRNQATRIQSGIHNYIRN